MPLELLNSQAHLFGAFPLDPDKLDSLRDVLAHDVTYFENLDLLLLDRFELCDVIKSAAKAKAMQRALTEDGLFTVHQRALLQGDELTWPDALVIMLQAVPGLGSVRLNLKTVQG